MACLPGAATAQCTSGEFLQGHDLLTRLEAESLTFERFHYEMTSRISADCVYYLMFQEPRPGGRQKARTSELDDMCGPRTGVASRPELPRASRVVQ